ncbi:MAG: DUF5777 family beta-barrel protein [Microscillaceae bacterium]|jgi:hypothetical protein|nr:DUF5777 family beta-barrel protein [Microscillaceae bacterium]
MKYILYILLVINTLPIMAQENELDKILAEGDSGGKNKEYIEAIFKGTRLINGQSAKLTHRGVLQFMISHRFGRLNTGISEFFGLDDATIRLGLDYGISDVLQIGIGRNSLEKTYDAYFKWAFLRQSKGSRAMPFTAVLFSSMAINGLTFSQPELENNFKSRITYTYQLILARKFSERFSLQVSPTLLHRNLVATRQDQHNVGALGFGGRYKLTNRLALVGEYFYVLPGKTADDFRNSFSLGFDIETGGHVFQLHLTNSQGMIEKFIIPQTTDNWGSGDIYFGFNISRVFDLKKRKSP